MENLEPILTDTHYHYNYKIIAEKRSVRDLVMLLFFYRSTLRIIYTARMSCGIVECIDSHHDNQLHVAILRVEVAHLE